MRKVLKLNRGWIPVDTCDPENAFKLLVKGNALALDDDLVQYTFDEWIVNKCKNTTSIDENMNTVSLEIPLMPIIVLKYYEKLNRVTVSPTKENIWKRDGMQCGYCLKTLNLNEVTRDHIHPKSKDGDNDWTNIISSCSQCNTKKADIELRHLPEMELKLRATRPNPTSVLYRMKPDEVQNMPEIWKKFFVEFK